MTEDTHDVLLVSEGLPPVAAGEIEHIAYDLSQMVKEYCGGETSIDVLGVAHNECVL